MGLHLIEKCTIANTVNLMEKNWNGWHILRVLIVIKIWYVELQIGPKQVEEFLNVVRIIFLIKHWNCAVLRLMIRTILVF